MLRSKGLTDKVIVLGIDGMDPRFSKAMVDEGKMPNLKKLIDMGAARNDLVLLGAMPTITPPLWATLATGAYPMTHGIFDYAISGDPHKEITINAFSSAFLTAEPIFNVTANEGINTLVFHWPGGAWPPSSDSENLYVVDGTSPGAMGNSTHRRDSEVVIIGTTKTAEGGFIHYGATDSYIDCDIKDVKRPPLYFAQPQPNDPRVDEYYQKFLDNGNVFQGYVPPKSLIRNGVFWEDCNMFHLADWPTSLSLSPIKEAEGWANAPEGAKEFVVYHKMGKVQRPALILKNAEGKYDKIAIYANKEAAEALTVLDNDVYTPNCYDTLPYKGAEINVVRNMRVLEIAEDASYVRIWASRAMSCVNDSVWQPKALFKEITETIGQLVPTSQMTGNDPDMIMKCNYPQWQMAADWQSKVMHHMIEEHGVEVIFSHMHNVDLQSHNYMKYMKNRPTSRYDESEVVKFAEATYKVTDDYLGTFMHLLDEGWTILLFSDHALISAKEESVSLGDSTGVCVDPFREWGYTVMKKDENGEELPEVDWTQTKAIMTLCNSIWLNVKGRDKYGIVDPEDKYELEEQIITDLYGYKHPKTGKRIVALALHNKDAVLLGLGGPLCADIIYVTHEDYVEDHGAGMSTAYGHNDTSLSPIFIAAGNGIKQNFRTTRYVREVDLAPTAAVLLGVDMPAQCEGAPAYQIFSENL